MALRSRNMIDEDDPRVSKIGHPAPPWLINYADLMTELVCFFIILYALSAALSKNVANAKEQLEEMMKKEEIKAEMTVSKEGLTVNLEEKEDKAFFESGRAEITENGKQALDRIVPVIASISSDVVIEGHTDDTPIHTSQFDSNWELSTARSTNVVKYLVKEKGLPPQRLSAIGYGEYRPLVPNTTPENRTKNRRVVIFIKK
ncbi:MAG: OmpA family protein [Elusimicrobia bacterium]|nr:OmpA family protein [Candidatus Liberimonas magnetica]